MRLFGLVQADRYLASLKSTFEFLGQFPLAARERPELSPSVRIRIRRT
ncbi:MAG: hypothetical protein U1C74_32180 [Phenylobacterium sp.]|nr:hypothetical protein [Phenylobacterium sp.]